MLLASARTRLELGRRRLPQRNKINIPPKLLIGHISAQYPFLTNHTRPHLANGDDDRVAIPDELNVKSKVLERVAVDEHLRDGARHKVFAMSASAQPRGQ